MKRSIRELVGVSAVPAVIASLCCLSPVILLSLGVISVTAAGELANTLYGEYKWLFRAAGLVALFIFTFAYIKRKKNICTLDEAKKRRNEIINTVALALIIGIFSYIVFLYGVVEVIGVLLHIW